MTVYVVMCVGNPGDSDAVVGVYSCLEGAEAAAQAIDGFVEDRDGMELDAPPVGHEGEDA